MREDMEEHAIGSCLCGGITFSVAGPFQSFFLCHCSRCRKDSGSAFAANMFSTKATITWLSGETLVRTYQLPSTRHRRSFCGTCGSAVPSLQMDGALLVVPAGSLDSAAEKRPDAHISFASRASWEREIGGIPRIDDLPG